MQSSGTPNAAVSKAHAQGKPGAAKKAGAKGEEKAPKVNEEAEQLRHIFNYFDTDRDKLIDAKTTKRILDLLGFHNPPTPSHGPAPARATAGRAATPPPRAGRIASRSRCFMRRPSASTTR